MVQNQIIKSVVECATMNRSYLSYFRNRNPFKFISNIFRNYKRSSDVKRNQSEPTVAQNQQSPEKLESDKPKSEINLSSCQNDKRIRQWNNSKYDDDASQDGVKLDSSNSASSNISLKKTSCQLDLNIKEKLNEIPLPIKPATKIPLKRAYPWQNFNLANARKPKYQEIKEVGDMRDEIIKLKKSILRRPDVKPPGDRESALKEVKFNKTASMLIYPKNNVMKQARINLSTNIDSAERHCFVNEYRKKKQAVNKAAAVKMCCPSSYKKSVKRFRKCLPMEHGHLWYLNNPKKQRIF